jgi:DNA-directed RNA polymerase I, II, and III subunit RPABC2
MSNIDSELSEVSDDELLSQSEGEMELSEKSDSNSEDFDDGDSSIQNSDSEGENSDEDDDPWILPDEDFGSTNLTGLEQNVELSDSSDSEDENVIDDDELKKIEKANQNEGLLDFHPEIKQVNYKELQTLCKIAKNKDGEIVDPLHTTIPVLTRYEKAKILGLRAKQINNGSSVFINLDKNIIDGHLIAEMELREKKLPFIIRRPMPNGGSEYWRVNELELLD